MVIVNCTLRKLYKSMKGIAVHDIPRKYFLIWSLMRGADYEMSLLPLVSMKTIVSSAGFQLRISSSVTEYTAPD